MARAEQQAYFIQSMNGLPTGSLAVPGGVLIHDSDGNMLGAIGISAIRLTMMKLPLLLVLLPLDWWLKPANSNVQYDPKTLSGI